MEDFNVGRSGRAGSPSPPRVGLKRTSLKRGGQGTGRPTKVKGFCFTVFGPGGLLRQGCEGQGAGPCRRFVLYLRGPGKVAAGFGGDDAAEKKQGGEIGQGHETIHDVAKVPNGVAFPNGADEDGHNPKEPIRENRADSKKIFHGLFAVVAPTQNR